MCDSLIIGIRSDTLREHLLGDEEEPTLDWLTGQVKKNQNNSEVWKKESERHRNGIEEASSDEDGELFISSIRKKIEQTEVEITIVEIDTNEEVKWHRQNYCDLYSYSIYVRQSF